jgi:hypothetical protein
MCRNNQIIPVKESFYRKIFNEISILIFSNLRMICAIFVKSMNFRNSNDIFYQNHLKLKEMTRIDRNDDREDLQKLIISFDLQKVITLPQSFVNNFYHKRKVNLYNLTASHSKSGYCALWDEKICGNVIASALIAILKQILPKYPELKSLIL